MNHSYWRYVHQLSYRTGAPEGIPHTIPKNTRVIFCQIDIAQNGPHSNPSKKRRIYNGIRVDYQKIPELDTNILIPIFLVYTRYAISFPCFFDTIDRHFAGFQRREMTERRVRLRVLDSPLSGQCLASHREISARHPDDPLVNIEKAIENGNFYWVFP